MKQRPLHSFEHRASVCANFMVIEPLMCMLLNFKGFIINIKYKNYFYLYFGCGIITRHTSTFYAWRIAWALAPFQRLCF